MERPANGERASGPTVPAASEQYPRSVIESRLLDLIAHGHRAASFQLEELGRQPDSGGRWRYHWLVDQRVECRVRLAESQYERVVPFAELWRLALDFTIVDVAPTKSALLWQAVAVEGVVETLMDGSEELTVYASMARDDVRGLAALVYSKGLVDAEGREAGDRVTAWLQNTQIAGAAARVRRAREQFSADESRAVIAAAAAEHLQGERAHKDGGVPPVELTIVETNVLTGERRVLASIGDQPVSRASSKRRRRLFAGVLRELERDAFGSRGNASRAFEPLADSDFEALHAFDQDVETQLDMAELVKAAGLTPRELEAFELKQLDKTNAEIAAEMGIGEGAVSAHLSNGRRKLAAEARENYSDYGGSV